MSVNEKMTAIADAIRDKTGGTEALGLDAMAESVGEVYESGKKSEYDAFWDVFQLNGTRNMYGFGFCGAGWNAETFKPKYVIKPASGTTTTQSMFASFGARLVSDYASEPVDFAELNKMLDFSQATSMTTTFDSAWIKNLTIDCSNVTSMNQTFVRNNGGEIDNITIKVSEKCVTFSNFFGYRSDTTTIKFTDDSVIAVTLTFKDVVKLNKASFESIINALSTTASGKTVTFSKTAKEAAFTADEWAVLIATKPNWTFSLV